MQPSADSPHTPAPLTFPGYVVEGKVGEGKGGDVYLARQLSLNRKVVIKPLKARRDARCEAQLMGSVHHPHIVDVYGAMELEGQRFLVMEHVQGSNLRDCLVPGRPWETSEAYPVLDAIGRAVEFIHQCGLLHLDLKPENILYDEEHGIIKVTDFGLAVPKEEADRPSKLCHAQGSMDYAPPEQRFGLPVNEQTDLFAIATVAYEILTGIIPGRVFVSASERNPLLPLAIDRVLKKGLARHREDRPARVDDFRRDLLTSLRP